MERNKIGSYDINPMESSDVWRNLSYVEFIKKLMYRTEYKICIYILDTVF